MVAKKETSSSSSGSDQAVPAEARNHEWVMRRATFEFQSGLQQLTVRHRLKVATALADYHREVLGIVEGSTEQESAALQASEAELQRTAVSLAERATAARAVQERLVAGRQASEAALRGAHRSLAEALHRAQLDALDEYQEARTRYRGTTEGPQPSMMGPDYLAWQAGVRDPFTVAADEGPAFTWPASRTGLDDWTNMNWSGTWL